MPKRSSENEHSKGKKAKIGEKADSDGDPMEPLPDALQITSVRGFLEHKDLGRLWLRTSKELTTKAFGSVESGALWKTFAEGLWGIKGAPVILRDAMKVPGKVKETFLKFAPKPRLPPMPVPELQFAPEDYALVIDIRDTENRGLIARKVASGTDVPEFFDTGKLELALGSDELLLWKASFNEENKMPCSVSIDVDILRLRDGKAIHNLSHHEMVLAFTLVDGSLELRECDCHHTYPHMVNTSSVLGNISIWVPPGKKLDAC